MFNFSKLVYALPRMKALVALPKVSGACAIAIARKYPSMNALFEAYLDPSRTVELLLYSSSCPTSFKNVLVS